MIHTNYLERLLDPSKLRTAVETATVALAHVEFDIIAVTGTSGLVFGGALSVATGKPIIVIRKRNDDSHSSYTPVEGDDSAHRYLFVDDQISSGETRRRVRRAIEHFNPQCVYVGTYTYDNTRFISAEEERQGHTHSGPEPCAIYDGFGNLDRYDTAPPTPPPSIVSSFWDNASKGSIFDLILPVIEGPPLSDDLTVIAEETPDVDPSELYNTAAQSRGG